MVPRTPLNTTFSTDVDELPHRRTVPSIELPCSLKENALQSTSSRICLIQQFLWSCDSDRPGRRHTYRRCEFSALLLETRRQRYHVFSCLNFIQWSRTPVDLTLHSLDLRPAGARHRNMMDAYPQPMQLFLPHQELLQRTEIGRYG